MTPDEVEQVKARLDRFNRSNSYRYDEAPDDVMTLLSERDSLTAALAEAQGKIADYARRRGRTSERTHACST